MGLSIGCRRLCSNGVANAIPFSTTANALYAVCGKEGNIERLRWR